MEGTTFKFRDGRAIEADEAYYAWISRDIDRLVAATRLKTHSVDRHHVLMALVGETYKRRTQPRMADLCVSTAEAYLLEFAGLMKPLTDNANGIMPNVPIFQQYATLLTEQGNFTRAIEVCRIAMDFGLADGTKGGFESRIKKIEKLASSRN